MISFQVSQIKYSNTKIMYDDQDYQHINQSYRVQAKSFILSSVISWGKSKAYFRYLLF